MKYLFTVAFVTICMASFGQANSIDGKWKGTRDTPNGPFEVNYTFKVEGSTLTVLGRLNLERLIWKMEKWTVRNFHIASRLIT